MVMWSAALTVLVVVVGCGMGSPLEKEQLALKQRKMVEEINNKGIFQARHYKEFEGLTNDEIRRKLGAQLALSRKHKAPLKSVNHRSLNTAAAPSFDAFEKWPACKEGILDNLAPGNCTADWAIAVSSLIRDRLCVKTNGTVHDAISAYDIISCSDASLDGDGCNGGDIDEAFLWTISDGVVTGDKYLSHNGCKPYPLPASATRPRPKVKCYGKCTPSTYKHTYDEDKFRPQHSVVFQLDNEGVMNEIEQRGPLVSEFELYSDFIHYSGGVYQHTPNTGDYLGVFHAKIIGWGVSDSGVSYWRAVANVQGGNWGEHGTFRILRGTNDVEFEAQIEGVVV